MMIDDGKVTELPQGVYTIVMGYTERSLPEELRSKTPLQWPYNSQKESPTAEGEVISTP